MRGITKYVISTAIRDKLIYCMGIMSVIAISFSAFIGSTNMTEQSESFVIYSANAIRLIINVGIAIFACTYIRRALDNKEIQFILTRGYSRIANTISANASQILNSISYCFTNNSVDSSGYGK